MILPKKDDSSDNNDDCEDMKHPLLGDESLGRVVDVPQQHVRKRPSPSRMSDDDAENDNHNDPLMIASSNNNDKNLEEEDESENDDHRHTTPTIVGVARKCVQSSLAYVSSSLPIHHSNTDDPDRDASSTCCFFCDDRTSTIRSTTSHNENGGGSRSFRCHHHQTLLRLLASRIQMIVILPCWKVWVSQYNYSKDFMADTLAGITVGVMIIPQSMSYAKLAGLPVQYGLYSSIVPLYVYALYGTSKHLSIGPVALLSLLLSSGLSNILQSHSNNNNNSNNDEEYQTLYNTLAIQASCLLGMVYIIAGICHMGCITRFLSHNVISGFTTGAAILILCSQIKYLVGYDITGDTFISFLYQLYMGRHQFNSKTFFMGTISIAFLLTMKQTQHFLPTQYRWVQSLGPLLLTMMAILLTVVLDLAHTPHNIPIVGYIPPGFPQRLSIRDWYPMPYFGSLLYMVLGMAIIGYMESIAIAKQLAVKHQYTIHPSQELIALGMANFMGSACCCSFPVTGSFSRTAVNTASGAHSNCAGIITASVVAISLYCLTSIFAHLPLNTLAAIVIAGVWNLIDIQEAKQLWQTQQTKDLIIWLLACFGTLLGGCETGLAMAVSSSLIVIVWETANPEVVVMGYQPETDNLVVPLLPQTTDNGDIRIVRIGGPLYFANVACWQEILECETTQQHHTTILDMGSVGYVDSAALHALEHVLVVLRQRSTRHQLCFAGMTARIRRQLISSGLVDAIGSERWFFDTVNDAVNFVKSNVALNATI